MKSLVWGTMVALLLSGCPGNDTSSTTDNNRLATMQREVILKQAIRQPYAEVGFRVSDKLPLHRSKILADLADPTEADVARKHGAEAMVTLRDSGWTVFHARCEQFSFTVGAYKVVDQVSYYAELNGVSREAKVSVAVEMRAPHSRESTSDLFPDRPQALAKGQSCLEKDRAGMADGAPIVLDALGPEPNGTPKPSGHR